MPEADTIIKIAITVIGVGGTLAVTLLGILIGRVYKSIDLLFAKLEGQQRQITVLMLAVMKDDPESTALFRALTLGQEPSSSELRGERR